MLALTARAAKRFRIDYRELSPVDTGAWVIDCLKLHRRPLLLVCVHQESLYTLIRQATDFRSLESFATEIEQTLSLVRLQRPLTCCRNGNRRVTGSMNEIKRCIEVLVEVGREEDLEECINTTIFGMIDYDCPRERFARLLSTEDNS